MESKTNTTMKMSLLLLHGALGSSRQFETLQQLLSQTFNLHSFDFEGHGDGVRSERPYRIEFFAENVMNYLHDNSMEQVNIVGYSMGGYVALYCAKHYPHLIKSVLTLGTKFYWTADYARREVKKLQPSLIEEKVPAFAMELQKRHRNHDWKNVLQKTSEMMVSLGDTPVLTQDDVAEISSRLSFGIAEKDTTVSIEETERLARINPVSEMFVLPASYHALEKIRTNLLANVISDFHLRS